MAYPLTNSNESSKRKWESSIKALCSSLMMFMKLRWVRWKEHVKEAVSTCYSYNVFPAGLSISSSSSTSSNVCADVAASNLSTLLDLMNITMVRSVKLTVFSCIASFVNVSCKPFWLGNGVCVALVLLSTALGSSCWTLRFDISHKALLCIPWLEDANGMFGRCELVFDFCPLGWALDFSSTDDEWANIFLSKVNGFFNSKLKREDIFTIAMVCELDERWCAVFIWQTS